MHKNRIVAMIALPIVAGFVTNAIFPDDAGFSPGGMVALSAFGVALLAFFFCLGTSPGRWIRRKVLPRLARALHPLEPDVEELDSVHRQLRTLGLRIVKKIKVARIESALAEVEVDPRAESNYDFSRAPRVEEVAIGSGRP